MSYLIEQCKRLKEASYALGMISTKDKDEALRLIIDSIKRNKDDILAENDKDVLAAKEKGTKDSLIDRLKLTEDRIQGILEGIETIIGLKDPIWRSNDVWTLENGLTISKMTVPLGVIGIIYESRPNVTVDAFL